jgi:branched-chain amino acid transport system substrate-binding protein
VSRRFLAIPVVVSLLLAAACQPRTHLAQSEDPRAVPDTTVSKAAPPPPPSAPAATPAPAKRVQKIGVLAPFSGRYAAHGRSYLDGVQFALAAFNAAGALQAEAVPLDTKADGLEALQATRRLSQEEGVVCILGDLLNTPTWVAAVEANCEQVPLVSNVASEDGIAEIGPWVFHEAASERRAAKAAADLTTLQLRLFRVALLYPEEGEGRVLATLFSNRVGELGGRIVAAESFASGTKDFTGTVRRIRDADPDLLYLPVEPETALLIVPALGFAGVNAQIVGTQAWNAQRLLDGAGVDLEGTLIPAAGEAGNSEQRARFEAAYKKQKGSAPSTMVAAGYLAARRVLDVLPQAPERESLRAALRARASAATPQALRFLVVRNGAAVPFATP